MEREIKAERSGWRDQSYSQWHRTIGWNAPACDIDSMVVNSSETVMETEVWNEYDGNECMALIEAKMEHAQIDLNQSSIKANCSLANKAAVPFLVVKYAQDQSWFEVLFHNATAKAKLTEWKPEADTQKWHRLTEKQYVSLLYKLRGRQAPDTVLEKMRG